MSVLEANFIQLDPIEVSLEGGKLIQGPPGESATIQIGSVTKGDEPSVTNSGTETDAIFNFVLPKGDPGPTGEKGEIGAQGPRGATFVPDVNTDTGMISWTNDGGFENPASVNIRGP